MTKGIPKVPAAVTLMRLHSRKAAVLAPATDMTEHAAAVPADKLGGNATNHTWVLTGSATWKEGSLSLNTAPSPFPKTKRGIFLSQKDLSVVFSVRTQPVSVQLWLKLARLCRWGPAVGAPRPEAEEGRGTGRA